MSTHQAEHSLAVKDLRKYYPVKQGFFRKSDAVVKAVDGVSFQALSGDTFGLVGESGCGKTTVARLVLRAVEPTAGEVWFSRDGQSPINITTLNSQELKRVRGDIQMVFQDPYSSLNPRMTVYSVIAEPLMAHGWSKTRCRERVGELLELVGLNNRDMRRYPHAFSGGQRQRICIARALALNPSLVVADEPVSALDVSVQAQTLNLLNDLQSTLGLTYLFIAHDLSVIRYICDRVAVMYLGKLVEMVNTEQLFTHPLHPYTSALIASVPAPNPKQKWARQILQGEISSSAQSNIGCAFAPRCPYRIAICEKEIPELRNVATNSEEHYAACFRAQELTLKGVV